MVSEEGHRIKYRDPHTFYKFDVNRVYIFLSTMRSNLLTNSGNIGKMMKVEN